MNTQAKLVAALREHFQGDSDAAIARRVGLSQQRFSNYATGVRTMDDDAIIGCANVLNLDARTTLAAHRAETAHTERERQFWRRIGKAAAAVSLATIIASPPAIEAAHAAGFVVAPSMHYAHFPLDG